MSNADMFVKAAGLMKEYIRFFVAYNKDGHMIVGQVRLCYKGLVYAWYAGSDNRYFKLRPNDFLMWNVICWAHDTATNRSIWAVEANQEHHTELETISCKIREYGRYQYLHRPLTYYLGKQVMNRRKKD